jgi:hypothetical protein
VEKSGPKIRAYSLIFTKPPKVNNDSIGENSPNLVTLLSSLPGRIGRRFICSLIEEIYSDDVSFFSPYFAFREKTGLETLQSFEVANFAGQFNGQGAVVVL